MLILGIHSGWRDAGAALFDEYRPLAVVPLARVSGIGHDGGRLPAEAVELCLEIAGALRSDVGGLALSHGVFPGRYFSGLPLKRRLGRGLGRLIGRDAPISLAEECRRSGAAAAEAMLDAPGLLGDLGLNRHIPVRFHAAPAAQGLLPLFQTDWQEALIFGADSRTDGAAYSARILEGGRLADLHGDEPASAGPDPLGRLIALAVEGPWPARCRGLVRARGLWRADPGAGAAGACQARRRGTYPDRFQPRGRCREMAARPGGRPSAGFRRGIAAEDAAGRARPGDRAPAAAP
jgi:hypothetical protein